MNTIQDIIPQIEKAGVTFASIVYTAKGSNETSRYTIILGSKYRNLVERSLAEVNDLLPTLEGLERIAAEELKDSFQATIDSHANNEQNPAYTKAGLYSPIVPGVNVNTNDNTLQLFGLVHSKVVLVPGVHKKVNSGAKTIAKNKIRQKLPLSRFREFALDDGHIHRMKINGNTLEIN